MEHCVMNTVTSDFFSGQDRAKKHSHRLYLSFWIAVLLIVLALFGAFQLAIGLIGITAEADAQIVLNGLLLLIIFIVVLLVVGIGTWRKMRTLSDPAVGERIAVELGARPVDPATTEFLEQRLYNIVEEMALASGMPVPAVYLLDDTAINACAAGVDPHNAVIVVTTGALKVLSRDEMQGVIAHEFSHIFHGDMFFNVKMVAVLHGMVLMMLAGVALLKALLGSGRQRHQSSSSKENGGAAILIVLGAAVVLIVLGWIGDFLARIIKSGFSRQREYLADAAALQYTRNPAGIGGALRKIGGYMIGSEIFTPKAREISHFFFADALVPRWLFKTHPPLKKRIQKIDPGWDGEYPAVTLPELAKHQPDTGTQQMFEVSSSLDAREQPGIAPAGNQPQESPPANSGVAAAVLASIGTVDLSTIQHVSFVKSSCDRSIRENMSDPFGARAVLLYLLLDRDQMIRSEQLAAVSRGGDLPLMTLVRSFQEKKVAVKPYQRMVICQVALPSLRKMTPDQFTAFSRMVDELCYADNRMTSFELVVRALIFRQRVFVDPAVAREFERLRENDLADVVETLFSYVSRVCDVEKMHELFSVGAKSVAKVMPRSLSPKTDPSANQVQQALLYCAQAAPGVKQAIITGLAQMIFFDGIVTQDEADFFQALALMLDVPVPPLVPDKPGNKG